jgi:hypothetical protein
MSVPRRRGSRREERCGAFIPGVAEPDPSAHGGRAARKGGRYNSFVPPNIAVYPFTLTRAVIEEAEAVREADTPIADQTRGLARK